ncbi:MAG: NADH-quinone oxidoreductase subunit NuoF [Lachnospiraceae bacterium]|nr:NADH-quinone oxidoreductase subunit NuoF [Lachnospiraceae bacterium]
MHNFKEKLKNRKALDKITIVTTGCHGLCALGPIMQVYPEGIFYTGVKPEDVERIVDEHILGGNPVKDLVYSETIKGDKFVSVEDTNFFKKQKRIALQNCGIIDPEKIDEYIGTGGYQALYKVLTSMDPDSVIKEVLDSGLRGRGGAGFPTGKKWALARPNKADQKYVACNADEGDPGAFMDRSILEGDPHCILEAMAIAGYSIDATKGFIYVRAEYPIAVDRLNIAIAQAREYGLLGKNIFGTGFDFDIELRLGAGAFVCGEETALMASIEGKRGEPHARPPFPALKGLFDKPTVLNNVETYANIPKIINNGAKWFKSMGTPTSPGTKVFALGGKVHNVGLVEVPMGITLREVIEDIGGGIPGGKKFKAAQTGGPSGGCISAENLDVKIDYDNLTKIGSMMGSGGLIVMDETDCMVDIAKFYMTFIAEESCGKCTPCRIGTKRMLETLERITEGKGEEKDLVELEELADYIKDNALCGLGQTAPNPILSTMKNFRKEYIEHIKEKKCSAGVCKKLLQYKIDADKCKGCTLCARNCPVNCITGTLKMPHVIDQSKCIKCGTCFTNCKFGAITKG